MGSYRRQSSTNHQDYLNERHSRKAASLKERKAKAAERIRLENEGNQARDQVERKISDISTFSISPPGAPVIPQQNSFDSEEEGLRKVSSCPHSVGTISASSSFVRLPGIYHSPSSSREEYSELSEYTVPWDCPRTSIGAGGGGGGNNNEQEEVDRNYIIRVGHKGKKSIKELGLFVSFRANFGGFHGEKYYIIPLYLWIIFSVLEVSPFMNIITTTMPS